VSFQQVRINHASPHHPAHCKPSGHAQPSGPEGLEGRGPGWLLDLFWEEITQSARLDTSRDRSHGVHTHPGNERLKTPGSPHPNCFRLLPSLATPPPHTKWRARTPLAPYPPLMSFFLARASTRQERPRTHTHAHTQARQGQRERGREREREEEEEEEEEEESWRRRRRRRRKVYSKLTQ